jgi:hypothetical protein
VTAQEQSAIDGCDANSEGQKYVNKQEKWSTGKQQKLLYEIFHNP